MKRIAAYILPVVLLIVYCSAPPRFDEETVAQAIKNGLTSSRSDS